MDGFGQQRKDAGSAVKLKFRKWCLCLSGTESKSEGMGTDISFMYCSKRKTVTGEMDSMMTGRGDRRGLAAVKLAS